MMSEKYIKAADLSTMKELDGLGARYKDEGQEKEILAILRDYDFNTVRLRLWNDPFSPGGKPYGAGNCDPEAVLSMARRVREAGMDVWLDLQYSDFWADPGKQYKPKAWAHLDAAGLEEAVYAFTAMILRRFAKEDISPSIVQVGNELTNGLLWPEGKAPDFHAIARFVSAGIRAVREGCPGAKVMIHLDNGGNREMYRNWFDSYLALDGADFDVIGLSYYPFWHGGMQGLEENMTALAGRYKKEMIVAETSTGFTLEDYAAYEKLPAAERKGPAATKQLAGKIDYPMTKEGQAAFIRDLLELTGRIPGGLCTGFCWWEPAWIPVSGSGWATKEGWEYVKEQGPGGNEWANQALFDYDGSSLPALKVIRDFSR